MGLFRRGGKDAATDEASDAVDAPVDETAADEVDELDEVVEVAPSRSSAPAARGTPPR